MRVVESCTIPLHNTSQDDLTEHYGTSEYTVHAVLLLSVVV